MALDRRSIGCLYISKIQRQLFKHAENCENVQRSSIKDQKKNKRNELLKKSAQNSQNTQFVLSISAKSFNYPQIKTNRKKLELCEKVLKSIVTLFIVLARHIEIIEKCQYCLLLGRAVRFLTVP